MITCNVKIRYIKKNVFGAGHSPCINAILVGLSNVSPPHHVEGGEDEGSTLWLIFHFKVAQSVTVLNKKTYVVL